MLGYDLSLTLNLWTFFWLGTDRRRFFKTRQLRYPNMLTTTKSFIGAHIGSNTSFDYIQKDSSQKQNKQAKTKKRRKEKIQEKLYRFRKSHILQFWNLVFEGRYIAIKYSISFCTDISFKQSLERNKPWINLAICRNTKRKIAKNWDELINFVTLESRDGWISKQTS